MKNNGNILILTPDEVSLGELRDGLVPYFNVFTASDTRTAARILKEFDMDVAMVAERLPNMSGLQFCESVHATFPQLLTVLMTSGQDMHAVKAAVKAKRLFAYLKDGFDADEAQVVLTLAVQQVRLLDDNKSLSLELKRSVDEQTRVMELFKRYVPEQVVSQTLYRNNDDVLVGETRVVSILFADIRNFTRFAARVSPTDVVSFLNDFWTIMTEPVRNNLGSVNKLIGDGVLAVFGAPNSYLENQQNAVQCALDMMEALKKVNIMYQDVLGEEIKIGIGINTGEVVVGNIGTADYLEYTVIGDAVNVASRIETMTKRKPNSILISESTLVEVDGTFDTQEVESLEMSGKKEPVRVYEVLGKRAAKIQPIGRTGTHRGY